MWQYGAWSYFPVMMIVPIIFLLVVVLILARIIHFPMGSCRNMGGGAPSAKEILDRRYASGEISQEEYQRIKSEIT
ncbi:MAG: SHOCT domain-containing protein [Acidocella sp.]|nr:SHOCT domain-containing protein [Acidocella sp.]